LEATASIQYTEITDENKGIYIIATIYNFMKWVRK